MVVTLTMGAETLAQQGKQGGVLRLPLTTTVVKAGRELTSPTAALRQQVGEVLETFIWRPPWLGKCQTGMDAKNRFEIELEKRKPPWRMVAVE